MTHIDTYSWYLGTRVSYREERLLVGPWLTGLRRWDPKLGKVRPDRSGQYTLTLLTLDAHELRILSTHIKFKMFLNVLFETSVAPSKHTVIQSKRSNEMKVKAMQVSKCEMDFYKPNIRLHEKGIHLLLNTATQFYHFATHIKLLLLAGDSDTCLIPFEVFDNRKISPKRLWYAGGYAEIFICSDDTNLKKLLLW